MQPANPHFASLACATTGFVFPTNITSQMQLIINPISLIANLVMFNFQAICTMNIFTCIAIPMGCSTNSTIIASLFIQGKSSVVMLQGAKIQIYGFLRFLFIQALIYVSSWLSLIGIKLVLTERTSGVLLCYLLQTLRADEVLIEANFHLLSIRIVVFRLADGASILSAHGDVYEEQLQSFYQYLRQGIALWMFYQYNCRR